MSARVRQQSNAPSQATVTGNALPPYQPPQFSLNPAAQRQLEALTKAHSHNLKPLGRHYDEALGAVTNSAGEINDRLTYSEAENKKRKNPDGEEGGSADAERALEQLRDKVDRMTQRMEESMRKLIDGQHSVESIESSVASKNNHVRQNASTQASTQHTRTQTPRRRRHGGGGEDDEDEDESYADFEPTDPAAGTQGQPSAIDKFRKDLETAKTRYQSHSLGARYAENNDYKGFRKVVHDARYHNNEVPLPHHTTWFPEGDAPAPGVTTRRMANAEEEDSDDDIAVSKATISTKCPLTLQEFKAPLTSTLCPHSFESEAIMSMIRSSTSRSQTGQPQVQCPVSGCSKMLTKGDLQTDHALVRKIKRIQDAKRLEEDDEEDDDGPAGTQRGATFIDDDDEDGADVDDVVAGRVPATQVKGEPRASERPRASQPGGTGVVDLGNSSDEAEEEEEEDEEFSTTIGY